MVGYTRWPENTQWDTSNGGDDDDNDDLDVDDGNCEDYDDDHDEHDYHDYDHDYGNGGDDNFFC